jgi:hypothetical protein
MPASSIIHAACFALGVAVGGGAVVAINASKKREALAQASSPKVPNLPIVEVGITGDPRLSAGAATAVGPVLKYGNPGTHATTGCSNIPSPPLAFQFVFSGPSSADGYFFTIFIDGRTPDTRFSWEIAHRRCRERHKGRPRKVDVPGGRIASGCVSRKVAGLLPQWL